jgi:hypothetical protein
MKFGNLTSWNPLGHSRPVTGLLYLLIIIIIRIIVINNGNNFGAAL